MAAPAAILSILVKAQGAQAAIGQMNALDAATRKAGAGTDDLAKRQKKGQEAFDKVGKKAGLVALGVGAIGAAAVNSAAKYEQSMNTLQAVSGSTGKEMDKLSKLAIKLGADVRLPGTSAQDAAEAMTEMIKAGVSLKDTMAGVRDTLVLSAAAGISNAEAAEIASNALNAFKLQGKDVKMVTDQLANTANASSVEIRDVSDSFKMAAAVFSGFQSPTLGAKKAVTELNVAIGLLGNAGIKGSDAGTSLKQMLLQLTGPSNSAKEAMAGLYAAATDNTTAESKLSAIIHGSAKERHAAVASLEQHNAALKKGGDIAYDSAGKMRSLKDIIALVSAGTKNMTDEEKNAYITQIFGADATRSVIALMNAGPAAFDKMTASVTKQGAAQALADAKMKGFKGSMEALRSTLETLAINVGTKLLPTLTKLVKTLSDVAGALSPTAWLVLIGVIGTLSVAVFGINAAVKVYEAGVVASTAVTWLWNVALTAATGGLNLVIPAIAAMAVAVGVAYAKSKTFRDVVDTLWKALRNGLVGAIRAVLGAFSSFLGAVSAVARAVGADGLANKAQQGQRAIDDLRDSLNKVPGHKDVEVAVKIKLDGKDVDVTNAKPLSPTPPGGDGPGVIGSRIADAVRSSKQVHDGAKRLVADGIGALIPGIGGKVGSLMGASSALKPFAALGAQFGLHVSSGLRPGAVTSSGNTSYHASGRAIDLANGRGPDAAKLAAFKALKSRYGSQLAELIYTPGGVGIKNGQPFRYTGQVAADHYDHVHVAFAGGNTALGQAGNRGDGFGRFGGDGIGDVARLARGAGFKGNALITAIAVAGAESGFRSKASNRNSNGSIDRGYWQINSVHGNQSTFSPTGNARAAFNISSGGSNWRPWVTYNTGAYRRYLNQARAAAGSISGSATKAGGGGASSTAGAAATAQKVNPLDQKLANADLAIEQAKRGPITIGRGAGARKISSAMQQVAALSAKRRLVGARIRSIRKALKGKLSPTKRLALTQELTQRLQEHAQLGTDVAGLMAPATTGGDGGSIADVGGGGGGDGSDPNQALIDSNNALQAAIEAEKAAIEEHTTALNDVKSELKRQTDLATAVQATDNFQIKKYLADVISGQVVGRGVTGRSFTPGTGVEYRV